MIKKSIKEANSDRSLCVDKESVIEKANFLRTANGISKIRILPKTGRWRNVTIKNSLGRYGYIFVGSRKDCLNEMRREDYVNSLTSQVNRGLVLDIVYEEYVEDPITEEMMPIIVSYLKTPIHKLKFIVLTYKYNDCFVYIKNSLDVEKTYNVFFYNLKTLEKIVYATNISKRELVKLFDYDIMSGDITSISIRSKQSIESTTGILFKNIKDGITINDDEKARLKDITATLTVGSAYQIKFFGETGIVRVIDKNNCGNDVFDFLYISDFHFGEYIGYSACSIEELINCVNNDMDGENPPLTDIRLLDDDF